MKQKKALNILTALAHDTRINIYKLLINEGKQGQSAGVISEVLGIPTATLSFHLGVMKKAGLLKSTKVGRTITYSAKNKVLKKLRNFLMNSSRDDNVRDIQLIA